VTRGIAISIGAWATAPSVCLASDAGGALYLLAFFGVLPWVVALVFGIVHVLSERSFVVPIVILNLPLVAFTNLDALSIETFSDLKSIGVLAVMYAPILCIVSKFFLNRKRRES